MNQTPQRWQARWRPLLICLLAIATIVAAMILGPRSACQNHPMFYFQGTSNDCAAAK